METSFKYDGLFTRAVRHRVLKLARFVFRFWGSTSGLYANLLALLQRRP